MNILSVLLLAMGAVSALPTEVAQVDAVAGPRRAFDANRVKAIDLALGESKAHTITPGYSNIYSVIGADSPGVYVYFQGNAAAESSCAGASQAVFSISEIVSGTPTFIGTAACTQLDATNYAYVYGFFSIGATPHYYYAALADDATVGQFIGITVTTYASNNTIVTFDKAN